MSWILKLRALVTPRLTLYAVAGFLWDRERITDEEVLRCLRESEERRGVPLTKSLQLPDTPTPKKTNPKNKLSAASNLKERSRIKKRVDTPLRSHSHLSPMTASRSTAVIRERRARQKKEEQRKLKQQQLLAARSIKQNEHLTKPTPQQAQDVAKDNSWWDIVVGYTLGAMYSSYKGVTEYFTSNNDGDNTSANDDYKPSHTLLCGDPSLLARKCLGQDTQQEDATSLIQSLLSTWYSVSAIQDMLPLQWIDSFVNGMVSTVNNYTEIPVPVSVFEDALVATDYHRVAAVSQWTPQEQLPPSVVSIATNKTELCDDKNDWTLSYQSNGTSLYVRPYQNTGLSQYRVISRFDDITAVDFLEVQADPTLRQQWDDYTSKMKVVDHDDVSNSEVLYWEMKFPFPLSKRDYVFVRRSVTLPHTIALLNRSTQHPDMPPSRGNVRVDNYNSVMVIAADTNVEKDGFYFELTYVDDQKCNMPSSFSSWASSSGMMSFLSKVHKAAMKRKQQGQ